MRPSALLKKLLPVFIEDFAGTETIMYFKFSETHKDIFTGTVDESKAYSSVGVPLPALVSFNPIMVGKIGFSVPKLLHREMVGGQESFDAAVQITVKHLTDKSVTLKVGDAFLLPGDDDKYYARKIIPNYQTDTGPLMNIVALSHRRGRR